MKNIKLSVLMPLLALSVSLTSCDTDEVVPADADMAQEITGNASSGATVYKNSYQRDFSEENGYFFTGCQEEPLRITDGVLRVRYTVVFNKNTANTHLHYNTSNFRLLDEATGAIYSGNVSYTSTNKYAIPNYYPYHFKQVLIFVATTPGKDNNIQIKADFNIKVDKNGDITSFISNRRVDCEK